MNSDRRDQWWLRIRLSGSLLGALENGVPVVKHRIANLVQQRVDDINYGPEEGIKRLIVDQQVTARDPSEEGRQLGRAQKIWERAGRHMPEFDFFAAS
jgi:hypothetical protein